jgi:hypothetical protein
MEVAFVFRDASPGTLRWVAVHAAHEVVHHFYDIELTAAV